MEKASDCLHSEGTASWVVATIRDNRPRPETKIAKLLMWKVSRALRIGGWGDGEMMSQQPVISFKCKFECVTLTHKTLQSLLAKYFKNPWHCFQGLLRPGFTSWSLFSATLVLKNAVSLSWKVTSSPSPQKLYQVLTQPSKFSYWVNVNTSKRASVPST
jgi:hypothetical protein